MIYVSEKPKGYSMPIPAEKHSTRYHYIDSLRGLAAFSVIIYHIIEFTPPRTAVEHALRWILYQQLDLGKIAVTLFFAISGYVVPFSLLRPSATPLQSFAISRIFRLYPAYWVSILAGFIILFWPAYYISKKELLFNITMLQQFFGVPNIIGVYWTLQIELIFYVICAVFFALKMMRDNNRILLAIVGFVALALVMGVARHFTGRNLPTALPLALSIMFYGYLYRQSQTGANAKLACQLNQILILFCVVFPVIFVASYADQWLNYSLTYLIALSIFICGTSRMKINSRIMAYSGKISYSLYLFGSLAMSLAPKILNIFGFRQNMFSIIIVAIIVAVPFSSLIYHLIELPFISFGRRLSERNERRT